VTELLAPAGNWDCARAAVANGADAIFFGMPRFNARMRADNFTEADLPELMDFLHRHGVRGFVAFNTLVFPSELEGAVAQIEMMARAGVDAVIVQDLGAAKLVREIAPEIEIHASTQMTITSPEGLSFIDELVGLDRAVLARELSVQEIDRVNKNNDVPLEVFVHGALCVAYSGQCLTSESLGQRSANRGECAQACRMPYELVVDGETKPMGEVRYLLSPQDLAAVDLIPDLVEAGVVSFKIEGRLKSPEYVAAVTRVYRKALDAVEITPLDRHILEMMFSRGLSTGWLGGTNHPLLTHGKWGKKRGAYVGAITASGQGWVEVSDPVVPIDSGNGFVIDAGEDRNQEQGGMVWKIEGNRLHFDRRVKIEWTRVKVGQGLWKTSDPTLDAAVRKTWKGGRLTEKGDALDITVTGKVGAPLILRCRGKEVVSETLLEKAEKRPLGEEVLVAQLSRLGGTGFSLGKVTNELEGEVIIPLGELNRCRRRLVEVLAEERVVRDGLPVLKGLLPEAKESSSEVELRVLCRSLDQVKGALFAGTKFLYCDFEDLRLYKDAVGLVRETDAKIFLATPRIQKPSEAGYFKIIERAEPDGVLIRNLGAISFFKDSNLRLIGDFSLNVANPLTAKLLMESGGFENLTISYDLNEGQVGEMLEKTPADWLELTVHQHMPMFHMEHCVFCTFLSNGTSIKDCGKPCETHHVQLRDRVGQLHTLTADVGCRNTLFNGRAQTGVGSVEGFQKLGLKRFRLELLEEDEGDAQRLVNVYRRFFAKERSARDVASQLGAIERLGVTKGTLEQRREEVHR
jgi:putative protease|tara:strand:+ start:3526 stop:5928 length:2403 start_codon:yes stop_codon:yes gene_type:complete